MHIFYDPGGEQGQLKDFGWTQTPDKPPTYYY